MLPLPFIYMERPHASLMPFKKQQKIYITALPFVYSLTGLNFLMINRLEKIIVAKKNEIQDLHQTLKNDAMLARCFHEKINPRRTKSMEAALRHPSLSVIAEIKRCSPSMGALADIKDPLALAEKYQAGGAGAISVLTDTTFFNGSLNDL